MSYWRYAVPLINTSLQRGGKVSEGDSNRFSGFQVTTRLHTSLETAEAVDLPTAHPSTSLKRGVNERTSA